MEWIIITPVDFHGEPLNMPVHAVSIGDAGASHLNHSTGPQITGTTSLQAANGQAPTAQLVWTQHPLAGFDTEYDNSVCWFEQRSNGLSEWHNCGHWDAPEHSLPVVPDGTSGGRWVEDKIPDWQEVSPDADDSTLKHQKAALASFFRQPGEDSHHKQRFEMRSAEKDLELFRANSSQSGVQADLVVSKASPSHLVLAAHACTLAAFQVCLTSPSVKFMSNDRYAAVDYLRARNLFSFQILSCSAPVMFLSYSWVGMNQAVGKCSTQSFCSDAANNAAAVTPVSARVCTRAVRVRIYTCLYVQGDAQSLAMSSRYIVIPRRLTPNRWELLLSGTTALPVRLHCQHHHGLID